MDGDDLHKGKSNEDTGLCFKAGVQSTEEKGMQKRERENIQGKFLKTQSWVKFRDKRKD